MRRDFVENDPVLLSLLIYFLKKECYAVTSIPGDELAPSNCAVYYTVIIIYI